MINNSTLKCNEKKVILSHTKSYIIPYTLMQYNHLQFVETEDRTS